MLAGHIGAAMALSKVERRLNLGLLVFAALLLDILLWGFVLLGWENVEIPADFATRHQLAFGFPHPPDDCRDDGDPAATWSSSGGSQFLDLHSRDRRALHLARQRAPRGRTNRGGTTIQEPRIARIGKSRSVLIREIRVIRGRGLRGLTDFPPAVMHEE